MTTVIEFVSNTYSTSERAAHPSKAQIHALLNVLENTQSLAKGFSKNPSARDAARRTWEKLAVQLNSLEGCVKTWKQWTKVCNFGTNYFYVVVAQITYY